MKNSVNLNSAEWCDIVFEGRNKSYGAFELRQSSWKRHIIAFGIILLLMCFVAALPAILNTVKAATGIRAEVKDEYKIAIIDQPLNNVEDVAKPVVPEPPKFVNMTKFVPPTIVEDSKVKDDEQMVMMDDVTKGKDAIGAFDVKDGSNDADAIRKEIEKIIEPVDKGDTEKKPEIFKVAEQMPQFPGGQDEMYKFIGNNLKYPVVDQEMGIQGRVTVRFVVSKTGEITNIELLKGISPTCDKEAIRVIKSMPKWIPGKQSGNPVQVYFTMPIVFKLKS
ncbi:energy transducer TonB [Dysgonomonas sp. 521]|uniref:energy transducer TonB n=1 Tax=Dysgonomonas sp. 521 TaxID=2302932 RepID=UPI0013D226AA|nr:energy transducer TonB [Dysgonomonas sp. 521]NDV94545.1 energy transducer TonB [Dysgonomonas sp. 521]